MDFTPYFQPIFNNARKDKEVQRQTQNGVAVFYNYIIQLVHKSISTTTLLKVSDFTVPNLTSNLACNFRNGIKCTFGHSDSGRHFVQILGCTSETRLHLLACHEFRTKVKRCTWIPDPYMKYPEYFLAISDDMYLFEQTNSTLFTRWHAGHTNENNPITYCEWSYWNPIYIGTLYKNGQCVIWSIESESQIYKLSRTSRYKETSLIENEKNHNWKLCFYNNNLLDCFITHNTYYEKYFCDIRSPKYGGSRNFDSPVLDVRCSDFNSNYVAYLYQTSAAVIDIRKIKKAVYTLHNSSSLEYNTCMSWCPQDNEIAIGTSQGTCKFWRPHDNVCHVNNNNMISYVGKIEYHRSEKYFLYISN
ncbi:uncharacterized protein [Centruroides vittatus]|uniref:uncharacterized protein n=1 Tax=Centruroides vittatus TaxID=120091 RepID=UPI00350F5817